MPVDGDRRELGPRARTRPPWGDDPRCEAPRIRRVCRPRQRAPTSGCTLPGSRVTMQLSPERRTVHQDRLGLHPEPPCPRKTLRIPRYCATATLAGCRHTLSRSPALPDLSVDQHGDAIPHEEPSERSWVIMRMAKPYSACRALSRPPQLVAQGLVQRREGLVQQQQRGPGGQGTHQATRWRSPPERVSGRRSRRAPDAGGFDQGVHDGLVLAGSQVQGPRPVDDVLAHRQSGETERAAEADSPCRASRRARRPGSRPANSTRPLRQAAAGR